MREMNSDTETAAAAETSMQARVSARLDHAFELLDEGREGAAATELEAALAEARAMPGEVEFQTRLQLAMTLADAYQAAGDLEKAREMLAEERDFAEENFQTAKATGTLAQKRFAASALVQIRDRATQVSLIGKEAPEFSVQTWINSDPITLASLRGSVVLLEFWATWCKPCQLMFPKLKKLHDDHHSQGLIILALTRHYFAQRGTASSEADELELIGSVLKNNGVEFPVGVAADERIQILYGAMGVPTLALIDRKGIVRYADFGDGADNRFDQILSRCLQEPA
jgi:thiol-disulfide isomerase/thioredoxin